MEWTTDDSTFHYAKGPTSLSQKSYIRLQIPDLCLQDAGESQWLVAIRPSASWIFS